MSCLKAWSRFDVFTVCTFAPIVLKSLGAPTNNLREKNVRGGGRKAAKAARSISGHDQVTVQE